MKFHSHYWVRPKNGCGYLGLKESLVKIREAFPVSKADAQKGRQDTEIRLKALTKLGAPQEVLEGYRYPGIYLYLHDEANAENHIECMIWPLQDIGVSFASLEHENECGHLLQRLAVSLGYEYELDPNAA